MKRDQELMALTEKFLAEKPAREARLFYLWGHSYEFEADDNWDVIEQFAAYAGGHDDVWYATNIEIYDYIQAYKRLEFSADGKLVYNPTATKLWLEKDGVLYCVGSGEMTALA